MLPEGASYNAYGFNKVEFNASGAAVPGDGRGQTVALFEVGNTPGLAALIHWGDGKKSAGKVAVRSTAPGFTVEGDQLYRTAGRKRITVKILERVSADHKSIAVVTHATVAVARDASA